MPTNRQPVYHESNSSVRVISMPNGLWMAQKLASKDGPWFGIRRPTSYENAVAQMNAASN